MPIPNCSNEHQPMRKRIIFIATEKGGVGKSTVSANIACWAKEKGARVVAIDPDDANHTLLRLLGDQSGAFRDGLAPLPVVPVSVNSDEALDLIYPLVIGNECDLVIVDGVGSQHNKTIMRWIDEVNFFHLAAEAGADVTFVLVLEEDSDVYIQAAKTAKKVGDLVDWVVVLNEKQHQSWPLWEDSPARSLLRNLGAVEVKLRQIWPHLVRGMQDLNIPLGLAPLVIPDALNKQRALTAWRDVKVELEKGAVHLLPQSSEAAEAAEVVEESKSKGAKR
jgi:hypothetical protein